MEKKNYKYKPFNRKTNECKIDHVIRMITSKIDK